MNIHQSFAKARYEIRGQDAHETGEHDEIRLRAADSARQILIEGLSRRVALVVDQCRFNACVLSYVEPAGTGAIADHQRDLSAQ